MKDFKDEEKWEYTYTESTRDKGLSDITKSARKILKKVIEEKLFLPEKEEWPATNNAIGIIFIEDNKLKIKTKEDETMVIASLDDNEKTILKNFMAIIAREKLKEK